MIKTSAGDVPVWGRIQAGKPLLLVIRGAFPAPDHLMELVDRLPHLSVAMVHTPGMHSPFFREHAPKAFALAYDEIVDTFGGPTVVLGASVGGLSAMAMRSRFIARRILLDTPLTTADLWPLTSGLRQGAALSPLHAEWVEQLFGVTPERVDERDYRGLVNPGDVVLVGAEPLGQRRQLGRTPSLVSPAALEAYRAGGARVIVAPNAGHDIFKTDEAVVMGAINEGFRSDRS